MTENTKVLNYIYETTLLKDGKTVSKRLKVARETISCVILENGQRIKGDKIEDFYKNPDDYQHDMFYNLKYHETIYTIHPVSMDVRKKLYEDKLEHLKSDLEWENKRSVMLTEDYNKHVKECADNIATYTSEIARIEKLLKRFK